MSVVERSGAIAIGRDAAILSLGAGVQSTALALMAARGELPLPAAAVFADTGWEPRAVYAHLDWLEAELRGVMPVHRVSKGGRPVSIRDDAVAVVAGAATRLANPPLFVKGSREYNPVPDGRLRERFERRVGGAANFVVMPLFARSFTGKTSQLRRQCTGEYKIEPIVRATRAIVGRTAGTRHTTGPFAEMWIGISAEERVSRCKPSRTPWITNRWPLRELGLTRSDCARWLLRHYGRVVPKSACVGCPYHDDRLWRDIKLNRPDEWADAVAFDRSIRLLPMVQGEVYVHRSCVPLDLVDLSTAEDHGQVSFLDALDRCQT